MCVLMYHRMYLPDMNHTLQQTNTYSQYTDTRKRQLNQLERFRMDTEHTTHLDLHNYLQGSLEHIHFEVPCLEDLSYLFHMMCIHQNHLYQMYLRDTDTPFDVTTLQTPLGCLDTEYILGNFCMYLLDMMLYTLNQMQTL